MMGTKMVYSGTLTECRRQAFANGFEIDRYEGYTVALNCGVANTTTADRNNFSRVLLKDHEGNYAGMIQRCQNDFALVTQNN
jgi:hypothetical protein